MARRTRALVYYIFPISHRFRLPFHQKLRSILESDGIDYRVIYCDPFGENVAKGDTVDVPWGRKVPLMRMLSNKLLWQRTLKDALGADLVIVQQENRLLLNYVLQILPRRARPRVAFFGHGRNFQARNRDSLAERWKGWWATRCDWWFAYTDETKRHVVELGFPAERVTVFNNAVDTSRLRKELDAVTPERLEARRRALGLEGGAVGLFVGGLYGDKRLDFLVEAALRVRRKIPDFELVVVGAGPAKADLRAAAEPHKWIKIAGAQFGDAKAEIMALADLFLMPGLVGLAVLDAGVAGLPVVTTAFPWHSPEIAYLVDGETGVIVRDWESEQAYAQAMVDLLTDRPRLQRMSDAARETAGRYTIEAMAERFADGIRGALNASQN